MFHTRPGRAEEIAGKYGTRAFSDAADVRSLVDAVTVAVPTESHVDIAMPFVTQGSAVLVEKPLAASLADADRLIAAAAKRGSVLAAGHTERFNPAVSAAWPGISDPRFVEVHRLPSSLGPSSCRASTPTPSIPTDDRPQPNVGSPGSRSRTKHRHNP